MDETTITVTTLQRKLMLTMNDGLVVKGAADEKKRALIYALLTDDMPYDISGFLTQEQLADEGPLKLDKKQATQLYATLKAARDSNAVFYSAIRKTQPIRSALAEFLGEVE